MSDKNNSKQSTTRRALLAAGGTSLVGLTAIGSVPTASAQPMEWAETGANEAAQLMLNLWGSAAEQTAQSAREGALEGIAQVEPNAPETVHTESVFWGTAYGSVIGASQGTFIHGAPDFSYVRATARGAAASGIATVTQYADFIEYLSTNSVMMRGNVLDTPPDILIDNAAFMRCPTLGGPSGALGRMFFDPNQSVQTTHDAAYQGVNEAITLYVQRGGATICDEVVARANRVAMYYGF